MKGLSRGSQNIEYYHLDLAAQRASQPASSQSRDGHRQGGKSTSAPKGEHAAGCKAAQERQRELPHGCPHPSPATRDARPSTEEAVFGEADK